MLAALDQQVNQFNAGSIIKGTVSGIKGTEVFVDIGYKSEGVVPTNEFEDPSQVKVGDVIDVLLVEIESENGMVNLSKARADDKIRWDAILSKYTEGGVVTGTIRSKVRGGLIVDVDGVDAFLPGSQVDVSPVHDPDGFLDQSFEFKVIKISNERRNIIVSRRELIEDRMADKKRELLGTIEKGQLRSGRVKNITDFGAFVDLDGLDGLLHITDMSWGRIKHPSEMVKVGQDLEVLILDVDMDRERVSLGLKQSTPNPWDNIEGTFPVGSRLHGKVVNLVPYGAFVEIQPGIEGLVHVSEFSWTKRVARASDVLNVGDEVDVVVLNIDAANQKIALGIRQTEANPWDTVQDRYPVGSRVSGKVRNFTTYGAFVELEEGIDGMIHVSDMSWTRKINHPSEVLQKGQQVEAVVLEVNPSDQRISLGLKQACDDPWNTITSRYAIGQLVKGKVSKIASFGAFIELEDGVDGLVHISQISDQHVEKVKDALKVGQDVEARIVKIDRDDRRIGLSIKAVSMDDSQIEELTRDLSSDDLKPGENLVGLAAAFDDAFAQSEEWRPGAE
ncbi:MAG: 30S ribosomal protein S1 [Kiritimatiellae bacterium]|nr:30S ribosomal protein S1 [Kiritimatiellia bacterium]MDD3544288.1 30S ribosomal protein S1 [Kiritimatiellia bacterium]